MSGTKALQGLRGVSSLYLFLYHSLSRTRWPQGWLVDLQGGILMPLFFLLSGFALARSYGPRISSPEAKYQHKKLALFSSEFWPFRQTPKEFSSLFFFKARLARVLPLYLLSNLLCLPLINWGFVADGNPLLPEGRLRLVLNLMSTFSLSNTWFLLLLGPPPSITSWTISTLAFFYLLFPKIICWAKTLSPSDRA